MWWPRWKPQPKICSLARKRWNRYLKDREAEPGDPLLAEAEAITAEIAKLGKRVSALAERLQAASSA